MYNAFQIRQNFVQYQDHSKTKQCTKQGGGLKLARAQVTQIIFIFLISKISFALKQIQRLHQDFFYVKTTFTSPKGAQFATINKHILAQWKETVLSLVGLAKEFDQ